MSFALSLFFSFFVVGWVLNALESASKPRPPSAKELEKERAWEAALPPLTAAEIAADEKAERMAVAEWCRSRGIY